MTREEMLDSLYEIKNWKCNGDAKMHKVVTEAIKALEQEPKYCDRDICIQNEYNGIGCGECEVTKSQEPCDDCISRQAVLNILDDMVKDYIKENDFDKAQGVAWVKVQKLPPVIPQPKTGHWIFDEILDKHYYCSECKSMGVDYWDYCPSCGAKMEEQK